MWFLTLKRRLFILFFCLKSAALGRVKRKANVDWIGDGQELVNGTEAVGKNNLDHPKYLWPTHSVENPILLGHSGQDLGCHHQITSTDLMTTTTTTSDPELTQRWRREEEEGSTVTPAGVSTLPHHAKTNEEHKALMACLGECGCGACIYGNGGAGQSGATKAKMAAKTLLLLLALINRTLDTKETALYLTPGLVRV